MSSLKTKVNYFFNKFYNNFKYSNSTISSLRIFFERTNKTSENISRLGNVYRNSK